MYNALSVDSTQFSNKEIGPILYVSSEGSQQFRIVTSATSLPPGKVVMDGLPNKLSSKAGRTPCFSMLSIMFRQLSPHAHQAQLFQYNRPAWLRFSTQQTSNDSQQERTVRAMRLARLCMLLSYFALQMWMRQLVSWW